MSKFPSFRYPSSFGSYPLDLSGLGDPAGSKATAGVALRVTGTHKLLHHDKVWIPSGGGGCWRRMEKISWTDHVRNEEVLLRVKVERNILHEIRKRKANWIGHILSRNCLLQRVIEGNIKGGIK